MRKIWRYKIFQSIVFILIASSLGIITSKLETLKFILENGNLSLENDIILSLIKDIKTVRNIAIILWGLVIGLYSNFIYSINNQTTKNRDEEV